MYIKIGLEVAKENQNIKGVTKERKNTKSEFFLTTYDAVETYDRSTF